MKSGRDMALEKLHRKYLRNMFIKIVCISPVEIMCTFVSSKK